MSHFTALRQRIKVIETIKKTTSAMRLISMSVHSRLRSQKSILHEYTLSIQKIAQAHKGYASSDTQGTPPSVRQAEAEKQADAIVLVVGSYKGLCGTFNEHVFKFISRDHPLAATDRVITVGKYATEYVQSHGITPLQIFSQFNAQNFATVTQELIAMMSQQRARHLIILSNRPRTFFSQKPERTIITFPTETSALASYVAHLSCKATLLNTLYESLLAEQAARFLSMDVAHRNAEDMLSTTKLDYNKARQTSVTRELTELAASMNLDIE